MNAFEKLSRIAYCLLQFDSLQAHYKDLTGKTVLITGAARGIGAEVTTCLAHWNAHVLLACRSEAQGNNLKQQILLQKPDACITVLSQADTADLKSMLRLSQRVKELLGEQALDGLILNAGIAGVPHDLSPQGFESHIATNVLGHHVLTTQLLPEINRSSSGRIIYVTGDIYVLANDCTLDFKYKDRFAAIAYARSKLGVMWIAQGMQEYLSDQLSAVKVITVHPGVVNSELMHKDHWIRRNLLISPAKSAQSIIYALTNDALSSGDYLHNVRGKMKFRDNDPALQLEKRQRFWQQCNDACTAVVNS